MSNSKSTSGPWKACLNVPNAAIVGHIIKADHGAECPIASLWVGGGTKGIPTQIANARLIAAAPDLLEALKRAYFLLETNNIKDEYFEVLKIGLGDLLPSQIVDQKLIEAAIAQTDKEQ